MRGVRAALVWISLTMTAATAGERTPAVLPSPQDLPVGQVGSLDELVHAYRAVGGTELDPGRIRWWEAMGNVKWAVLCARQAHDHLTGVRPSAELASLGRRICEPEWDLLELVQRSGSSPERVEGAGP